MPRHLINDAHEWMNEIPPVPIYLLVNQQARERTCMNAAGKEDPVELDSNVSLCHGFRSKGMWEMIFRSSTMRYHSALCYRTNLVEVERA